MMMKTMVVAAVAADQGQAARAAVALVVAAPKTMSFRTAEAAPAGMIATVNRPMVVKAVAPPALLEGAGRPAAPTAPVGKAVLVSLEKAARQLERLVEAARR